MAKVYNLGRTVDADENGTLTPLWPGGDGTVHVGGTWDGATITIQYKPSASQSDHTQQWSDTDIVLTSGTPVLGFSLGTGEMRYVSTDTGGSTDLDITITKL